MHQKLIRALCMIAAFICIGLGSIGIFLPILPTTPFFLLALFLLARSSKRFHDRFVGSWLYRKYLASFVDSRAMTLKTKLTILIPVSVMLMAAFIFINNSYLRLLLIALMILKYVYFFTRIQTIPKQSEWKMKDKISITDERIVFIINKLEDIFCRVIGQPLVGIYIHGSIAFQSFHWETSDIDFLVVVQEKLKLSQKKEIMSALMDLDSFYPTKGIEMSVVLEADCLDFKYPTPYQLHFSNKYKVQCETNLELFCENSHGVDKDLAAHFTVLREVGLVVFGKPILDVFNAVPRSDYLDSILNDVASAGEVIDADPAYYGLNLCRVAAYCREGLVLSKEQGGRWGIDHLPEVYHVLITDWLNILKGQYKSQGVNPMNQVFVEYMLEQIRKANVPPES